MKHRSFAYVGFFLLGFGLFFAQGQSSPRIESKYVKSIAKLKKSKEVKRAFQEILALEDKTLKRHITLTEIPAPPWLWRLGNSNCAHWPPFLWPPPPRLQFLHPGDP